MTNLENIQQESKSIYNAILNVADNGLNLSPRLFKAQVKAIYLQWRLESFTHLDLTVTSLEGKTLIVEDDIFEDEYTISDDDLYEVFGEPYVIDAIGEFDHECFGTLIEEMYINTPYELGILCSFAIHNKYLQELFEDNYKKTLMRYTNLRKRLVLGA